MKFENLTLHDKLLIFDIAKKAYVDNSNKNKNEKEFIVDCYLYAIELALRNKDEI